MRTREHLLDAIARGETPEFLLFWGHRPPADGSVGKSCFSQWFEASFQAHGNRYATAEHFMMASKAGLFGDVDTQLAIIESTDPAKAKALGRKVKGFNDNIWLAERWNIVVEANLLKFSQNEKLKSYLLGTGGKVLVEASPVDPIWGIGLAADSPDAVIPSKWRGLNLLGFALMEVRTMLNEGSV